MATGLIAAVADAVLDGTDDGLNDFVWIQLHTGDPGAAGTSNVATENTRVSVSSYSISDGVMTNGSDAEWENVADTEDYTHFSAWDAETSGNCGFTGTITADGVNQGDNFLIAAGDLTVSLNVAS